MNGSERKTSGVILVFVDGLGLGADDPAINPLARAEAMPRLTLRYGCRLTAEATPLQTELCGSVPIDAVLSVAGLPQSATGQTTLLTGINAQAALGHHANGFPGQALQSILKERSIFRQLAALNLRGTFANAFTAEYFAAAAVARWRYSATTLAALSGGVRLRFLEELLSGQAVYQDLTREALRERGYDVPCIAPGKAGVHLARIARGYDFTLFEYFQTDITGHSQAMEQALHRLSDLDAFLDSLLALVDPGQILVILASDHGNIEDLSLGSHTANPVPVLAFGAGAADFLGGLTRLDEVTPRIVDTLCPL